MSLHESNSTDPIFVDGAFDDMVWVSEMNRLFKTPGVQHLLSLFRAVGISRV
ncbi:hypothetical protein [Undibacterium aquatile]|uniref:Uncharacterized protein n=1 Tax=Undibacterium aquatile TaxID=1537398 RepID=A0ABR6XEZ4_9BURK|nr:hypothetical protein [Undibacterium aquatile]MBC3811350.1 hypothetical protein [Undibacterium aquatile]